MPVVTAPQTFVIVGGGLAAGKAVQELRESGFDGHIVLYGEEAHPPYERPPLSKGYLMGDETSSPLSSIRSSGTTPTTSTSGWTLVSPPSTQPHEQ